MQEPPSRDLETRLHELETSLQEPSTTRARLDSWAKVIVVGLLASVPATIPHLLDGPGQTACDLQLESVARAVEAGVDSPENLDALLIEGCSRTPQQMADDIAGEPEPAPEP